MNTLTSDVLKTSSFYESFHVPVNYISLSPSKELNNNRTLTPLTPDVTVFLSLSRHQETLRYWSKSDGTFNVSVKYMSTFDSSNNPIPLYGLSDEYRNPPILKGIYGNLNVNESQLILLNKLKDTTLFIGIPLPLNQVRFYKGKNNNGVFYINISQSSIPFISMNPNVIFPSVPSLNDVDKRTKGIRLQLTSLGINNYSKNKHNKEGI